MHAQPLPQRKLELSKKTAPLFCEVFTVCGQQCIFERKKKEKHTMMKLIKACQQEMPQQGGGNTKSSSSQPHPVPLFCQGRRLQCFSKKELRVAEYC